MEPKITNYQEQLVRLRQLAPVHLVLVREGQWTARMPVVVETSYFYMTVSGVGETPGAAVAHLWRRLHRHPRIVVEGRRWWYNSQSKRFEHGET
jgi:hypothetical protein